MTAIEWCAAIATGSCCIMPWCVLLAGVLWVVNDPGKGPRR